MTIRTVNGRPIIRCDCGHKILSEGVLRIRVALIDGGRMTPKCPNCKKFDESFPIDLLTK
jgi:hypothetical protein